jgi:hypothetical protein
MMMWHINAAVIIVYGNLALDDIRWCSLGLV